MAIIQNNNKIIKKKNSLHVKKIDNKKRKEKTRWVNFHILA